MHTALYQDNHAESGFDRLRLQRAVATLQEHAPQAPTVPYTPPREGLCRLCSRAVDCISLATLARRVNIAIFHSMLWTGSPCNKKKHGVNTNRHGQQTSVFQRGPQVPGCARYVTLITVSARLIVTSYYSPNSACTYLAKDDEGITWRLRRLHSVHSVQRVHMPRVSMTT